ncbi:MAG: hypothetical protein WBA77_20995 [Microcoleaceae cyanobacterium]
MNKFKITSAFQYVFFTVVSLTLLSGGASFWLASQGNLTPEQNRVFETSNTTWNMGIGAIFGLLGSKATDLLEDDEEDDQE